MTALLPAVPTGHVVPLEIRHTPLDAIAGMLEARDLLGRALLAADVGACDALERILDLAELVVDHRLVAVEREAHDPPADVELARDPVDDRVGHRLLPLEPLIPAAQDGAQHERVVDRRHALDRAVEEQHAQRVHHRAEVVLVPDPQPERHVALRVRHQPDAHLRDDPEVRLHEELVRSRAETALVDVPGTVARHRAHPGAHDLAVREHDLHPALHAHVLPVRHVRDAVVERVADDAPPAEVRDREHQPVPARLDRLVEVEPAHARLDDRVRALVVDLEHAVHPAETDDHGALHARRGAAVAVVPAGPVRPQRNLVLVRDPHDLLDLLDGLRHERPRRPCSRPRSERRTDHGTRGGRSSSVSTASAPSDRPERLQRRRECLLRDLRARGRSS